MIYFLLSLPALVIAFVYFSLLFLLPVLDPLSSSSSSLLVLSLQLVLLFISFLIISDPASFLFHIQNSKLHWLSHCITKGAKWAEFQTYSIYYLLIIRLLYFLSSYLFFFLLFYPPPSLPLYFSYFRFIFFSCFLSLSHPVTIYFSFLLISPAVLSHHEPLHSQFSSSSSSVF